MAGKRDQKNYRQFIPPEFEGWIDSSDADTPQQSTPEQTPSVHSGAGLPDSGEFTFEGQDTGNGERLVKKFGYLIRWISETNEWMVWGEKGWRKDNGGRLMRMTKSVLSDLMDEAYEGKEVDRLKLKHALISGSMPRRMAMIASAGYETGLHQHQRLGFGRLAVQLRERRNRPANPDVPWTHAIRPVHEAVPGCL